jgi:hypothetical protein
VSSRAFIFPFLDGAPTIAIGIHAHCGTFASAIPISKPNRKLAKLYSGYMYCDFERLPIFRSNVTTDTSKKKPSLENDWPIGNPDQAQSLKRDK